MVAYWCLRVPTGVSGCLLESVGSYVCPLMSGVPTGEWLE